MTLLKLNLAKSILIEDDYGRNSTPLLIHLTKTAQPSHLNIICYEQPAAVWQKVFQGMNNECFEKFPMNRLSKPTDSNSIYFIDSINQMALDIGWHRCLKVLQKLQCDTIVKKVILILHKDCISLTSKLRLHLNYIINSIISFEDEKELCKAEIQIKKGGKLTRTIEVMSYDTRNHLLKLSPVPKVVKKSEEAEKVLPNNLSTFKIETDQLQQIEKHKLQLPYMSKINEGQGKVYYEPDAVDDWDEEDPDDDLEI